MKTSDFLVQCLEQEGVQYVFGVPGEENEDLMFSLEHSSITFVPTRHEQGAAFMANVWGRLTGKAGVCLATLGPGATNLITGLGDAFLDKSPVVAITGQGSSLRLHKESHQVIDVIRMFRPMTKWNISIQNPLLIAESVRKAFKLAQEEKPGVTHIELPEDIAKLSVEGAPLMIEELRRGAPDDKALVRAITLIRSAKRPLILAGNGTIRKHASTYLRTLVELTNIPVVSTFMAKGAVSDREKQSLGAIGLRGNDFPVCALDAADLVIAIGFDIAEYDPTEWNKSPDRPLIHIDFTSSEIDAHYQPAVQIVADISATLQALIRNWQNEKPEAFSNWFLPLREAIETDRARYATSTAITVPWVLHVLRTLMSDNDIIISDVGSHKMWIGRNFPVYEPGTCIISNGFASMGIAVPGMIAGALSYPNRRTIAVNGDGGFLMNSQEIETAKRLGIKGTIIILNDNNYGLITWKQIDHTGKSFGTQLTNPDFKMYGESFGVKSYYIKDRGEVEATLKEALSADTLTIVAIDIDPGANARLSKQLRENVCPPLALN